MMQMYLNDELTKHFRLTTVQKNALKKLGILTIQDLLWHFPSRYENIGAARNIADITADDDIITVYGELKNLEKKLMWKTKKYAVEADVTDTTGSIQIRWFNQPYVANMLEYTRFVKVTGKPLGKKSSNRRLYLANPTVEPMPSLPTLITCSQASDSELLAIYPESKGITSRWFQIAVKKVIRSGVLEEIHDHIPKNIIKTYNLPSLATSLVWMHVAKKERDARAARKRFAFDEVFTIQLAKQRDKQVLKKNNAPIINTDKKSIQKFIQTFPYTLTGAQNKAVADILADFNKSSPMSRLLEGDVGSGKTAVAAACVYAVATSRPMDPIRLKPKKAGNLQIAYMVPTEILARQQFESFIEFFRELPLNIGLITSSGCMKFPSKTNKNKPTKISRAQLLKWVENGEIPILVGTHSLIQKSIKFQNLSLVIIDEQHRFGTIQRKTLLRRDYASRQIVPHLLSMTATPIPRTLALTIYGDLDLTLLDEMPKGRKEVYTKVVPAKKRDEVYAALRSELNTGRQAYVICPRIDEPDPTKALALRAKSVLAEAKKLKNGQFKEYSVGTLHGKMLPNEKETTMKKFENGEIDILVATSVVEVGVNVANATIILIEGAERFGLSQLHQLRGRVRRSTYQSYCYLFSESKGETSIKRLKALEKSRNGFELAERDLELRGAGELYGAKQWGITDIGMEAIRNIKMVEAARKEAQKLIESDQELEKHPKLKTLIVSKMQNLHFE